MDLTEQATAIADAFSTPERTADFSRLDAADEVLILRLHRAGKSQAEIAQAVGCDPSTISRKLAKLTDSRAEAVQFLHAEALTLAKRIVNKADVTQSLEVLDRLDVAPRKERGSGTQGGVQIIIGMPNQPAALPPVIDLSPLPARELGQ